MTYFKLITKMQKKQNKTKQTKKQRKKKIHNKTYK